MLTLLLGEDIYAKQAYLDQQLAKADGELQKHQIGEDLPKLCNLGGASLFGGQAVHVFVDLLREYDLPELEAVVDGTAQIYFWEDSLDKRLTKTKQLYKIANVKEFPAPSKEQATKWITTHADELGINIQPSAATLLAQRLIGENKLVLPVVAAHHELLKLSSFAGESTITTAMVEELTPQDLAVDLFTLLDLIGNKNKPAAVRMLQQYYDGSSEDEKALTIRLVALLSDQFRSLLIAQDLLAQGLSDQAILQATGWKSGRLFVMKKIGRNFSAIQLSSALTKLYNLDKELKSSTLPPRAIIDMIVAVI